MISLAKRAADILNMQNLNFYSKLDKNHNVNNFNDGKIVSKMRKAYISNEISCEFRLLNKLNHMSHQN